ncbi:MAG: metal-dependent hydrolase [Cocleimonas sp.]
MANFNTHFGVAAISSGMLATLCLQVGFVDAPDALLLASAGVIGGILPDIDLHYSYPSRILFSLLGIILSFLWVFSAKNQLGIIQLWGAGLGLYLFVRFPLWALFQKFSVHRGAIHSINAALLFSLASASLSSHLFARVDFTAWLIAFFIFSGFILHLVLDEIYSVDFMGHRLKRSFGTALKIIDLKEPIASASIAVGTIIAWYFAPDASQFIDTLTSKETYQLILERMF